MQCRKKKQSGTRCRGRALTGEKYCLIHSEPSKAAELGRKGGRRRTVYNLDGLKDFPAPRTPVEAGDLMAQSMVDVRMGKMDPRIGTALAYMMVAYLKAMELSEEKKPPAYPDIYRGLTEVKRTVRPEVMQQNVVHQGLPAQEQSARPGPKYVDTGVRIEEEIAPGVYRY